MRQWVATFPRRVRYHLAADPKLASEALREVTRTIFAFQRCRARRLRQTIEQPEAQRQLEGHIFRRASLSQIAAAPALAFAAAG